jgi:hypothetical protein
VFKILGVVVIVYTVYAATRGEVFAKSGPWGRVVARDTSPRYFWAVIVIYAGLGLALLTVF